MDAAEPPTQQQDQQEQLEHTLYAEPEKPSLTTPEAVRWHA